MRKEKLFCLLLNRRYNLIAIDAGFFCMCYVFNAVFFSIAADRSMESWLNLWPNFLIFLASVIAGRFLSKVYRNVWRYPNVRAYLIMVLSDICSGAVSYLFTYVLSHQGGEPFRYVYIDFWQTFCVLSLFVLSTLILRFVYQLMHQTRNKGRILRMKDQTRIAILGAGRVGCHLAEELQSNPNARYKAVCFIDCNRDKVGMRVADLDVYGEDNFILDKLSALGVQEIFLTINEISADETNRLMKLYGDGGFKVKVYDIPTRDPKAVGAVSGQGTVRELVKILSVFFLLILKSFLKCATL